MLRRKLGLWTMLVGVSVLALAPRVSASQRTLADASASHESETGSNADDARITADVKASLAATAADPGGIEVDTDHKVVTLMGSVASDSMRRQAVAIAKRTPGVRLVKDEIAINPNR